MGTKPAAVLVTCSSSGIGKAVAAHFARDSARVVVSSAVAPGLIVTIR